MFTSTIDSTEQSAVCLSNIVAIGISPLKLSNLLHSQSHFQKNNKLVALTFDQCQINLSYPPSYLSSYYNDAIGNEYRAYFYLRHWYAKCVNKTFCIM